MNPFDPFKGNSHTKGTSITSGTLPRDQKQVLQREDTLHMDPHAKVAPNRQFACDIKQLFFVFNHENMQLSIFFHNTGKMKNVKIRDLVKS